MASSGGGGGAGSPQPPPPPPPLGPALLVDGLILQLKLNNLFD